MVPMNPLWWMAWSAMCAVGTGVLVYFIMQSRMESLLSKQREDLAEARGRLSAQKETMQETLSATKETSRREALDDMLADIRVEERHYIREQKMLFMSKKSMVRQERVFFRNIPLTGWVEQEMPLEEGADPDKLLKTMALFSPQLLLGPGNIDAGENRVKRLLR